MRNLANQVGALPALRNARTGRGLPLTWCWFNMAHGATYGVEHARQLYRTTHGETHFAARAGR